MAILGSKNSQNKTNTKEVYHFPTSKNALIIFTRNPELGKCKTRLAATVGNNSALEIYKYLLQHTVAITTNLKVDKFVYYSVKVREDDYWSTAIYRKKQQKGNDLGVRMHNAFTELFSMGYERVIIIGSDMYDITTTNITNAFKQLETHDYVIGPALDGGYYLLGMQQTNAAIFNNKKWGTHTVLKDTLSDLKQENIALLDEKNDVDYYEDIKDIEAFQQFITHLK